MTDPYAAFFLSSRADVVQLELIEVTHPNFTRAYRIVRNARRGVTVTLPDLGPTAFEFFPLRISKGSSQDDLSQSMRIDIGDLGEEWPEQLDAVAAADGLGTRPTVRYWAYRSDDLSAPLVGPLTFEVKTFSFSRDGASFEAEAPQLNALGTGELYKLDRFTMLRGFL